MVAHFLNPSTLEAETGLQLAHSWDLSGRGLSLLPQNGGGITGQPKATVFRVQSPIQVLYSISMLYILTSPKVLSTIPMKVFHKTDITEFRQTDIQINPVLQNL